MPTETEVSLPNENTQDNIIISSTQKTSQPSPSDSPTKTSITHDENTQRNMKDSKSSSTTQVLNVPLYALPEELKSNVSACTQKILINLHHIIFINLARMKVAVQCVFLTTMSVVIY